jgi:hypothetical protein
MSTLFRGITKTVPSLFRGIFSERNFDGNPTYIQALYVHVLSSVAGVHPTGLTADQGCRQVSTGLPPSSGLGRKEKRSEV